MVTEERKKKVLGREIAEKEKFSGSEAGVYYFGVRH